MSIKSPEILRMASNSITIKTLTGNADLSISICLCRMSMSDLPNQTTIKKIESYEIDKNLSCDYVDLSSETSKGEFILSKVRRTIYLSFQRHS